MAQKAIREYDGKKMIARLLPNYSGGSVTIPDKCVQVRLETRFADLEHENPWLVTTKLVV